MATENTTEIPNSRPRSQTVMESQNDDKKAGRMKTCQYVLVFIICFSYFVGQLVLFSSSEYNKTTTTSIEQISTMEIPFVLIQGEQSIQQLVLDNNGTHCGILMALENGTMTSEFPLCEFTYYHSGYIYDTRKASHHWTIIRHEDFPKLLIILPPYGQTMPVTERLLFQFVTFDNTTNITNVDEYIDDMEHSLTDYHLQWYADYISFKDIESPQKYFERQFAHNTNRRHILSSWQEWAVTILDINHFGDVTSKYSLDRNFGSNYADSDSIWRYNNAWYHWTVLGLTGDALHTKTTIKTTKKITFLDCVSKTGGIFSLIYPASTIILLYLLSGLKMDKKCKIDIPGIAPNTGLNAEEKRKILTFLKEIELIQAADGSQFVKNV